MPSEKNIIKVKELQDTFSKARAVYFTEYHGLDVGNNLSVDGDHISVADLKPETSRHLLDV